MGTAAAQHPANISPHHRPTLVQYNSTTAVMLATVESHVILPPLLTPNNNNRTMSDEETTYTVEYAKSGRAMCKGPKAVCESVNTDRKIEKGKQQGWLLACL